MSDYETVEENVAYDYGRDIGAGELERAVRHYEACLSILTDLIAGLRGVHIPNRNTHNDYVDCVACCGDEGGDERCIEWHVGSSQAEHCSTTAHIEHAEARLQEAISR